MGRICGLLEIAAIEAIRSGEERDLPFAAERRDLVTESLVSITDRRVRRVGDDESLIHAPAQLPFAPRPIATEGCYRLGF